MRGFAVIVMVMGHSIDAVLSQQVRATDAGFTGSLLYFFLTRPF